MTKNLFAMCEADCHDFGSPRVERWSNFSAGIPLILAMLLSNIPGLILVMIFGNGLIANLTSLAISAFIVPIFCLSVAHAGGTLEGYHPVRVLTWATKLFVPYLGIAGLILTEFAAIFTLILLGAYCMMSQRTSIGVVALLSSAGLVAHLYAFAFRLLGMLYRKYSHTLGGKRLCREPLADGGSTVVAIAGGTVALTLILAVAVITITNLNIKPGGAMGPVSDGNAAVPSQAWTASHATAVMKSQQTGKPILASFSGSDWCHWCIKLDDEVFSTREFEDWAEENVVLLYLDFPKQTSQPADIKAQNMQLAMEHKIQGFPTVVFLTSDGQPLGRLGYMAGGPSAWTSAAEGILSSGE